jgi:serpin B
MIRSYRILALAVLVAAIGCKGSTPPPPVSGDPPKISDSNNAFAIELYGRAREADGNICLAPYSAWTALAMTAGGARGETAAEMARVLHLAAGDDRAHAEAAKLMRDLKEKGQAGQELTIANALWAQQGFPFREEFLSLGKTHYNAGLSTLDFAGAREAACQAINSWVAKETGDKIKNLVQPQDIGDDIVLVLTNATHFKAEWRQKFNRDHTQRKPFFLADGGSTEVDLMSDTFGNLPYVEEGGVQAVMLPYKGNRFSMVVLLPRKKDGLAALEKELTGDKLTGLLAGCKPRLVEVFLPKFQFSSSGELKGPLAALGMRRAFNRAQADFSGMSLEKGLFLGDVIQQTFIDVNEEGTEAAGATAVYTMKGEEKSDGPPPTPILFRADHPFLYLIRDDRSDCILFVGRLTDPRTAEPRVEPKPERKGPIPPPRAKEDS